MNPNISEFSYGYALTDDFIHVRGLAPVAAPYFPSLLAEGGLGYDVRLQAPGLVLFLQFKLAHCMVRNAVREIRHDHVFPPGTHFYRFYLHRTNHSDQHQLLLDLEAAGHEVYYAAPAFHQPGELDDAYLSGNVAARSVFARPSWIGAIPDNNQHYVAFVLNGARRRYSEPSPIDEDIGHEAFTRNVVEALQRRKAPVAEMIKQLPDTLMTIVRAHAHTLEGSKRKDELMSRVDVIQDRKDGRSASDQVAYIARTFFGAESILITTRPG